MGAELKGCGGVKWCLQKVDVMSLCAPLVAHIVAAVHHGAALAGQHTTILEWSEVWDASGKTDLSGCRAQGVWGVASGVCKKWTSCHYDPQIAQVVWQLCILELLWLVNLPQ